MFLFRKLFSILIFIITILVGYNAHAARQVKIINKTDTPIEVYITGSIFGVYCANQTLSSKGSKYTYQPGYFCKGGALKVYITDLKRNNKYTYCGGKEMYFGPSPEGSQSPPNLCSGTIAITKVSPEKTQGLECEMTFTGGNVIFGTCMGD